MGVSGAGYAFGDREFWGPEGLGCSLCHEYPAIVWNAKLALCESCLMRCFQGWDFDRVVGWLGRQVETRIRRDERVAALKAHQHGDDSKIEEYKRSYGVDITPGSLVLRWGRPVVTA